MKDSAGINQKLFTHNLWAQTIWGWAWGGERVGWSRGGDRETKQEQLKQHKQ